MSAALRGHRRAAATAALTLAVGATLVATAPAQAGPGARGAVTLGGIRAEATQVDAPVPTLDWAPCDPDTPILQCATAQVPLDYDDPTGPTITLDLLKVPARQPDQRLGTLFLNPGGPGGSATEFAAFGSELLGNTVTQRYDVVGIDPRGVGSHSQVVCTTTVRPPKPARVGFPITEPQSKSVWHSALWARRTCQDQPNAILTHMSTADTARDMDLIRQAVGEELLNYYGVSYGTYLGATYAAMFPDRVGRFVVDGVLDPVKWATGDATDADLPFSTRLKSARGAYEALTTALTECDRLGKKKCRFAGNAQAKWHLLIGKARRGQLMIGDSKLAYQDLVGFTLGVMYDNQNYDFLGMLLQRLYVDATAGRATHPKQISGLTVRDLRRTARETIAAPYAPARTFRLRDSFLGVACADTANPTGRAAWWDAGRAQDRQFPWYGSLWTWASAPCANWNPAADDDAFRGPFQVTTANPILVVGNSHDPATPVQGARRFTRLFGGSRFLLMDGWGHGAIGTSCVTAAFDAYYATGALPREGAVCAKDGPLFTGAGPGALRPLSRWRPQG